MDNGAGIQPMWGDSDSSLRTYLRDVRKVPLLTRDEEVSIAKRISRARWVERQRKRLEGLKKKPGKDAHRRRLELATKLRHTEADVERARQELTLSNLRLVVSLAKKYVNRGLSLMDLIQEGNLGLMRAVEKFDYLMGNKFSTYAVWWIKQALIRAIADKSRVIRIPVHMVEIYNQVVKHARDITQGTRHEAKPTEIAARMGIPVEKVTEAMKVANVPIPLEKPIGEDKESTLAQVVADPNALSPMVEIMTRSVADQIRVALRSLSPREEKIIKMRFGLDAPDRCTLDEVGRTFSVTRERIRQIEAGALRKLRTSGHRFSLRDMMPTN